MAGAATTTTMPVREGDDGVSVVDKHAANLCAEVSINERILKNPLVISLVISHLDLRSLYRARLISREWFVEVKKAIRKRKDFLNVSYVYDTSRRANAVELNLLNQRGIIGHTKKELIDHVQTQLRDHLWSKPKFGFMFLSGPKKLLADVMRSVKQCSPPDCQILGLLSMSGFIPAVRSMNNNSFVSCELQLRSLSGINFSLWPCFHDVEFTVFNETSSLSEFTPRLDDKHKKLKALLIFSTSYMTRNGRHESYKRFTAVNETFDAYKRKIALAGVVVDVIQCESTCSSDDESESDDDDETAKCSVNGKASQHKPCNPSMAGLAISGENVRAASAVLDCECLEQLETELTEFKQSLDFDADICSENKKTIGFLFTCSGRGPAMFESANAETGVINKVFPNVYFTGIFGDGEYGENYWPKCHQVASKAARVTQDRQTEFWHFYTNVIALIHVEQQK